MADDMIIKIDNVSKDFNLPSEKLTSLKSRAIHPFKKIHYKKQHALKNISLEIKKGEFFGIVGRNGSGKSTLLKLLAGIYQPTKGSISVRGKLVPFIELGVGFNPELSGRENVFLNGALLGFSEKEVALMYDDIVEFAELGEFMEQKLKNYSSGMQVRLAFSIAIRANAEVLLLDEVLAVGDEAFQRKCYQYFAKLRRQKQTVILVTHNMDVVQQFCDRVILIDKGHKTEIGSPLKITQIYRELNDQDDVTTTGANDKDSHTSTKYVNGEVKYVKSKGKHIFDIQLYPKAIMKEPIVAMGIYKEAGEQIFHWASDEKPLILDLKSKTNIRVELDDVFPMGVFSVGLYVRKRDRTMNYAVFNDIVKFEVKNLSPYKYAIHWKIPEHIFINDEEIKNVHG